MISREEAIEYFVYCLTELKMDTENIREAYELAIEDMQKQIPQKPSWEYLGDNLSRKEIITLCPCCYESIEEGEHHCNCGQAIDWSDSE